MLRLLVILLMAALPAYAGIEGKRPLARHGGIVVPGKGPTQLECWFDGRRHLMDIDPADLLTALPEPEVRVVVRGEDGSIKVVTLPGRGVSGCLPTR